MLAAAKAGPAFAGPQLHERVRRDLLAVSLVGMASAPDGRMFVWQKNGMIRVVKHGVMLPTPFLDLAPRSTPSTTAASGASPFTELAANGYVYLTYIFESVGDPETSRARPRA